MSEPASESRRFWAWAGPCEPQPITPICLIPSSALGSEREQVAAAADDGLLRAADVDDLLLEDLGLEVESCRHVSPPSL